MSQYLTKVHDTLKQLDEWTIKKVSRADNIQADALAGIATSLSIREAILLPIQVQANPSIAQSPACNAIKESQEWTSVIKEYLGQALCLNWMLSISLSINHLAQTC